MFQVRILKFSAVNKKYDEQQTQPVTEKIFNKLVSHIPIGKDVMSYKYELLNNGVHVATIFSYTPLDLIIYKLPKDEVHPATN